MTAGLSLPHKVHGLERKLRCRSVQLHSVGGDHLSLNGAAHIRRAPRAPDCDHDRRWDRTRSRIVSSCASPHALEPFQDAQEATPADDPTMADGRAEPNGRSTAPSAEGGLRARALDPVHWQMAPASMRVAQTGSRATGRPQRGQQDQPFRSRSLIDWIRANHASGTRSRRSLSVWVR